MTASTTSAALICIDLPGLSASIVLRGTDVPAGQPSREEALVLLERVVQAARGEMSPTKDAAP